MAGAPDKKSDVITLLEIRNLIERSSLKHQLSGKDVTIGRIHNQLMDLNAKFDELRDIVITAKSRGDSPRKIKTKKEILSLLKTHQRLNSDKLGRIINLSRVRANEYLRELEGEGLVKGIVVNKKKLYLLADDLQDPRALAPAAEGEEA